MSEKNWNEHILVQRKREDAENKRGTLMDQVVNIATIYYNNINNEDKHYLNAEDERSLLEKPFINGHELSFNIDNNPTLHVGSCLRQLYFKIKNYAKSTPKSPFEVFVLEKLNVTKKQIVHMFELAGLVIEKDVTKEAELNEVTVKAYADAIIYNTEMEREELLLIKPVNGFAKTVTTRVFPTDKIAEPMELHLGEVFGLLCTFKIPVNLLYVDKNDTGKTSMFNIGFLGGQMIINGAKYPYFDVNSLVNNVTKFKDVFEKNNYVPARSYMPYKAEDADMLLNAKIINTYEVLCLKRGEAVENFRCKSCPYKEVCDSLAPMAVPL